uniref:Integrase catalytic domain-containing protein n=1 Tax=Tanacetum cinerariifolium TaxID=118510 RepID=A0A699GWV1_TANCI|nr:hypothetical protein [Tanacetum cinerariifolium]
MRTDELHKFSNGTLNDVRTALHDIAARIRTDYLPMRKWSNIDMKKAWVMVQDIDKQLYQRSLMWNLGKFVGERHTNGMIKVLPPKSAEEVVARKRKRKARTTLLMALPEDHLAKFHKIFDAKEMWEAIKSRFQTLLSQLEIHGAGVSHEDANQKFLRSLPSSWSQVALIKRTKPWLDTLSFDDLYNNLVFERDVKGTTASSSNTHNVAFVFADNTSSTNNVSTAYSVSSPSVSKSQKEGSSSYTDEVIHSFFANQSSAPQPDYDDLEKINDDDMEDMVLKWQVAMISLRIKKFRKRTGKKLQFDTKDLVGFDKTKVECFNCHKIGNFARDCRAKGNQDIKKRDASNSGSDNEVKSCSKTCEESYAGLKKLYDEQRDKLGDASVEIIAYTLALKKESDLEDTSVNDRYAEGMHAVPPPITGNYIPSGPDEYESDSDTDSVSNVQENKEKPSFTFTDFVKHVKTSKENVKESDMPNHSPKVDKRDRNGHTRKGLGYAFTRKACFVCGSFSHLIRDCDFRDKGMAKKAELTKSKNKDDPHRALKDKGIVDSGCSRHMTGNKAYLADYQEFKEELKHYNLFYVSQMCDKKNKVLFIDTDCLVLSPEFKLPDENQVLPKIPRQHNMYSFNLKNINPFGDLACLFVKASIDESNKWHRRLGHVNFKNLNKNVKGNLVRGLPFKIFEIHHTCVACQKGKQHKASCKAKTLSYVNQPLQILHMDLFGPTSIRSINHKTYCLVITDGFSRFSWVYFLKSKDETTPILKDFKRQAENQFNHNVKTIKSDNRTEFKNNELIEFCGLKGVKRGVLVTKPQNKTPYELLIGKQQIISYLRPFGCHVTILNTIDQLGKFDGKFDSGYLVGYSLNSKAFRVYNLETKRVEENLHVNFLDKKPNVAGKGHAWMFDLDYLTIFMNYKPRKSS